MNTLVRLGLSVLCGAIIFGNTSVLQAQQTIPLTIEMEDNIESTVTPSIPGPLERVTITVVNYSGDFTRAYIEWYENGELLLEGVGENTFSFITGGAGETTTILMRSTSPEGKVNERNYKYTPSLIDLVWESDTYTPPAYKGKALHTIKSPLTIVALPTFQKNGILYSPNELVYTWSVDGKPNSALSGFNKQSIQLTAEDTYRVRTKVNVRIATVDNSIIGEKEIIIPTITPFVVLYEQLPLIGTNYSSALSTSFSLTKKEFSIIAEPYFFDITSAADTALSYTWKINGSEVDTPRGRSNTLTLRQQEGSSGRSSISLNTTHSRILEQRQKQNILIEFGND